MPCPYRGWEGGLGWVVGGRGMELKLNRTHIRHAVPLQGLGGRSWVGDRALGGLVARN